ncbi:erv26 super protein [Coemansia biformis]|uniref:Erv26 super protein n=1 Tax=Coemansia biformis TaxID=1286918 RepID=A0A9W8CWF3_9FUNG|nr:erv26 super protein [Coemansia biformis]
MGGVLALALFGVPHFQFELVEKGGESHSNGSVSARAGAGGVGDGRDVPRVLHGVRVFILSEWAEEHPRQARRAIQGGVWAVDALLVLAALDGLSAWRVAVSAASNHVYALHLAQFPLVRVGGALVVGSCALALGNHFLWFFYFMQHLHFPFGQVCSFIFFGVWLVPLALFVSLTPADSSLPNAQAAGAGKSRRNILRTLLGAARPAGDRQGLHTE